MTEEVNFVSDLAVILIAAGLCTIISRALKQPAILGYIIAGFIIGPEMGVFGISNTETVKLWSDIGIIFLMFGLGLEFSFKKLLKAGRASLATAGSKFLGVFVIGYMVGKALMWTTMESIFLAGLLSMSSTMVVVKSYGEMGLGKKSYAPAVFGTLVFEDLIAILLMVLLSTLAVSNKFSGGEMLLNLGKLLFFIILWFLLGIYLIPTILKKTGKYLNDEILLIVSLGLCFGMVALATRSGFSSALGAFMMGSILAETVESEHIDRLTSPIKDLFGAIFFVSVGMMLAPQTVVQYWWLILVLAVVVVLTHVLFASFGIILSGGGLNDALHTGFSLAQLGEFGFIIAGVGVSLGVMREFIYPVIIAVSVITIFTTPYTMKLAEPVYKWLRNVLPLSILQRIDHSGSGGRSSAAEKNEWHHLLKAYLTRIGLYGVLLIAILILGHNVLAPFMARILPDMSDALRNLLCIIITLSVMSPFLYGMAVATGSMNEHSSKLIADKKSNIYPIFGMTLGRIFIALGFVLFAIEEYVNLKGWVVVVILAAGVVLFMVARSYFKRYDRIERRFLSNLNEKENSPKADNPAVEAPAPLPDPDLKIHSFTLNINSPILGKMLKDSGLREHDCILITVRREDNYISTPRADFVFQEGDTIWVTGSSEALEWLK